jgi:hypothetical protein
MNYYARKHKPAPELMHNVFLLKILYHFVRLIHAVVTNINLAQMKQYLLRYLRITMPAEPEPAPASSSKPQISTKTLYHPVRLIHLIVTHVILS